MISAYNNSPSFTSVIPVRVFIDGMETFDDKLIKSSCRNLSSIVAKTTKSEKEQAITRKFVQYDPNYKSSTINRGKPNPSDFIRCIIDKGRTFLCTGLQAAKIKEYGKAVGTERQACKIRGVNDSFDLMVAKKNYARIISEFVQASKLRLKDGLKPLNLNLNMKSNGKYGLSSFKINLDDISFS
jgi:hypothetical protein